MKKILFVTQKSNNAIGLVDMAVKKELWKKTHNMDFLELGAKWPSQSQIIFSYIKNIFKLLFAIIGYKKIYFSRENPYIIFIKIFFPWKIVYMCVHHVEEYRSQTFVGKMIFHLTDFFIAISHFTKKQIIDNKVDEKKIFVNYNGIGDLYFPEKIANFVDFEYVLYVWNELERKNIKNLLLWFAQVVQKYPNIKLVKIGKAVENETKTNNLIKELWIESNVILKREFIAEQELRKRYSNAICYISVSKLEWFGLTVPEAMACGCPVVVSDIPPFVEIVGDSGIVVDPKDTKNISDWIIKYIENADFRREKSKSWIEVAGKFSRRKNTEKLMKLIS